MNITVYTDGAARGNPGPGGYGIVLMAEGHYKEISQGYKLTTNNRMELLAVIVALESLKIPNLNVTVYSDSSYVVDAVEKKWIWNWLKKGFKGKKNEDLWRRFLKINAQHKVSFIWVKGHADNPYNNRCDILATTAAMGNDLLEDTGYISEKIKDQLFDNN